MRLKALNIWWGFICTQNSSALLIKCGNFRFENFNDAVEQILSWNEFCVTDAEKFLTVDTYKGWPFLLEVEVSCGDQFSSMKLQKKVLWCGETCRKFHLTHFLFNFIWFSENWERNVMTSWDCDLWQFFLSELHFCKGERTVSISMFNHVSPWSTAFNHVSSCFTVFLSCFIVFHLQVVFKLVLFQIHFNILRIAFFKDTKYGENEQKNEVNYFNDKKLNDLKIFLNSCN